MHMRERPLKPLQVFVFGALGESDHHLRIWTMPGCIRRVPDIADKCAVAQGWEVYEGYQAANCDRCDVNSNAKYEKKIQGHNHENDRCPKMYQEPSGIHHVPLKQYSNGKSRPVGRCV